jgi:inhibitor of cysteine peptidase
MNNYRITILVTTSILIILLLACATAAKPGAAVTVTCDQFSKKAHIVEDVTAAVGSTITVTLCSNPTTGFQWGEQTQISNAQVLKQASYKTVGPANTGMAGAPGNEVWTFQALQAGASTVSFSYSRPWEGGEKGVETFKLNVTVQ